VRNPEAPKRWVKPSAFVRLSGQPRRIVDRWIDEGYLETKMLEQECVVFGEWRRQYFLHIDAISGLSALLPRDINLRFHEQKSELSWAEREIRNCYGDAKKRAKNKGWEFTICLEDILAAMRKVGNKCWLTGVEFKENKDSFRNPYRPSIDRVHSNVGYVPDNVRIVAYAVNAALNDWGDDVFFDIVRHANTNLQQPSCSLADMLK